MLLDASSITADSVRNKAAQVIAAAKAAADEAIATGVDFDSLLAPLERLGAMVSDSFGETAFMGFVHSDADVRAAAQEVHQQLEQWGLDLVYRDDLYHAIKTYSSTAEAGSLSGERARLLEFNLRDLRRAGHELDPETRQRVKELNGRLIELSVAFERNIAEHDDFLLVTREDLEGLPDSYIESLDHGEAEGTLKITMAYPHVVPFMDNAARRDLRKALAYKFNTRAVEKNRPILAEAVTIRHQIASLFGVPSWAHHRLEVQMAKTPEAVDGFYAGLQPALTEVARQEIARLTAMLKTDTGDNRLQAYDWRYYDTLLRKTEYGVDQHLIAQYFPLDSVLDGLFEITGEVFGLAYRPIDHTAWHPDVRTYAIDDVDSGELIGYFHADLFPREGKFTHAAAFSLLSGRRLPDSSYQPPVSAIVANFTKPTDQSPALMRHAEVETLFHEFGHILHQVLTRAALPSFAGTRTERDFVEAPSQIMEHWVWKADVLNRFARHHLTGEPIPADLVEKLTAAKNLNIAIATLRQMSFGVLDMGLHGPGPADRDLDAVLAAATEVSLLPHHEGTFFPASFGHLLSGYDAGYYGYLWSEVFGDDMFSRFEEEGYTNPAVGRSYRREVLEKGGSVDAIEMLRGFLGREPDNRAFLRNLGIDPS